jgi:hypothetical protein
MGWFSFLATMVGNDFPGVFDSFDDQGEMTFQVSRGTLQMPFAQHEIYF